MQQISALEFSNISNINNNEKSSINEDEDRENQIIYNEIHDNTNATSISTSNTEKKTKYNCLLQNLCCYCNNTANEETIFISPWQPEFKITNVIIDERHNQSNLTKEIKFLFIYQDEGKETTIPIKISVAEKPKFNFSCCINGYTMVAKKTTKKQGAIKNANRVNKIKELLNTLAKYKDNDEITSLSVQCLFIMLYHKYDLYCSKKSYDNQCDAIQGALLEDWENKLKKFEENMRKKIDEEEEKEEREKKEKKEVKKQDEIQEYNDDCRCWGYSKNHIKENETIIHNQMNVHECNNNSVTKNIDVCSSADRNNINVGNDSLRSSVFK